MKKQMFSIGCACWKNGDLMMIVFGLIGDELMMIRIRIA